MHVFLQSSSDTECKLIRGLSCLRLEGNLVVIVVAVVVVVVAAAAVLVVVMTDLSKT